MQIIMVRRETSVLLKIHPTVINIIAICTCGYNVHLVILKWRCYIIQNSILKPSRAKLWKNVSVFLDCNHLYLQPIQFEDLKSLY